MHILVTLSLLTPEVWLVGQVNFHLLYSKFLSFVTKKSEEAYFGFGRCHKGNLVQCLLILYKVRVVALVC